MRHAPTPSAVTLSPAARRAALPEIVRLARWAARTLVASCALLATVGPALAREPAVVRPWFSAEGEGHFGGTAFFLATGDGEILAVAAAHSFPLATLAKSGGAQFLLGAQRTPVARSLRLRAPPGVPFSEPGGTIRGDLILFALEEEPAGVRFLRLGAPAQEGERVRILGIPQSGLRDEDDIFGTVRTARAGRVEIDLDVGEDLRSWGGAPVLRYRDGTVIAVVQAARLYDATLRVAASPVAALREMLAAADPAGVPFFSAEAAPPVPPRPSLVAAVRPAVGSGKTQKPGAPPAATPGAKPTGDAGDPTPVATGEDSDDSPAAADAERGATGSSDAVTTAPGAAPADIDPFANAVVPAELILEIDYPEFGAVVGGADAMGFLAGRALAPRGLLRPTDMIFVLDTSGSTAEPSGADVNGNGVTDKRSLGGFGRVFGVDDVDPGDSILAAEVASARHLVEGFDPRMHRIGLVTFAGETRGPYGGEVYNAATTIVPLTRDYNTFREGLEEVLARGSEGATHMAAGVDQATRELLGLRGAHSTPNPKARRVVLFLTDGQPTLPYPNHASRENRRAVLRAAERAARAQIRVYSYGIGQKALARPEAVEQLAEITEGIFTAVHDPADLVRTVAETDFSEIESMAVRNLTADADAASLERDGVGHFAVLVPLATGENRIRIRVRSRDGREVEREHVIHYNPDGREPAPPRELVASRNALLQRRLVELQRSRVVLERERTEQARRELVLEIEREKAAAQRRELELEVEDTAPAAASQTSSDAGGEVEDAEAAGDGAAR